MWRESGGGIVAVGFMAGIFVAAHPHSTSAANACATHQTDNALRPLSAILADKAADLFGLKAMPPALVAKTTVMRCMDGNLMVCNEGANLPCGKANTAAVLPAGRDWCQQNPNADYIPAYISGHDSIYSWRCMSGTPAHSGTPAALDSQGFFKQYWKIIEAR